MSGIDWKRYAQLCEEVYTPTIERLADSLRKAAGVATYQSMPVYTGAMKACIVTALRQMTDTLKRLSEKHLTKKEQQAIQWKKVEERMRAGWLKRLCSIEDFPIARDYADTRIHNRMSDSNGLYLWANGLRKTPAEIDRIVSRILEETRLFAEEDVPMILELAQMGIGRTR